MEDPKLSLVVERLFNQIDILYGKYGAHPKPYHNLVHTRNVMMDADALAVLAGASPHERILLQAAAAGHDVKHGRGAGNNERASAAVLYAEMIKAGFEPADAERASELVLATTVTISKDKVVQAVTSDHLSRILADADVANLGKRPLRYWANTLTLYREHYPERDFDRQAVAWFGLDFITKHNFNTAEAEQLFPYKESNIKYLEEILAAQKQL